VQCCQILKKDYLCRSLLYYKLSMDLKEIVAIGGIGGLHKIIGRTKSGLILETMAEPKKRFATGMHDKVSVLDDISMYTLEGDIPLSEVFIKLNATGNDAPSAKENAKTLRDFVNTAVQLDNERVYDSDIKKLITWYNLLKDQLDFAALANKEQQTENVDHTEVNETVAKEKLKPTKTTTPKVPKTAAPKDTAAKVSSKGAGTKNTYRPKSV
jgi:hypothetical protein